MDGNASNGLLYEEETYRIRGAAFHVYRTMGPGFLEGVYQECLAIEMARREIPFGAQRPIRLQYDGESLKQTYVADFLCYENVLLELKAARTLIGEHRAQLFNYLRASGIQVGLLINFGSSPRIQLERFVL
jgi:GxxExxY protein